MLDKVARALNRRKVWMFRLILVWSVGQQRHHPSPVQSDISDSVELWEEKGMRASRWFSLLMSAAAVVGLGAGWTAPAQAADKKFKIYLSMSYIGNDWQAEAENEIKAMAASKSMRDKVDLQIQVAGPNAQKQIQQINAMIQAGAQAILVYPISPTALNAVVKTACDRGIVVAAYDSIITEPCAYNFHIDQEEWGQHQAEWLAKKLNGKGDVVIIDGVPGTSVDTLRKKGELEVLAKYPDIHVVAEANGMWSQAVARTELSKILATHSWDKIDGLLMQAGCYTAVSMMNEAGIPDDKLRPCGGEASNGGRVQMLPADTKVEGANGTYRPMGAPRLSSGSQNFSGALALKAIVAKLEGKEIAKLTIIPQLLVSNENVKVCLTGSWQEMQAGCNVFQPSLITNPGWFSSIFSPETPEVGVQGALNGTPEE
jgi:ribose transport system substrate-binding protein